MSRSRLKDKWIKKEYHYEGRNPHHLDEMPKNKPSKIVTTHCSASVSWLQEPRNYGGHKPRRGGHRRVSGLVRTSLKEELRRDLKNGNV